MKAVDTFADSPRETKEQEIDVSCLLWYTERNLS